MISVPVIRCKCCSSQMVVIGWAQHRGGMATCPSCGFTRRVYSAEEKNCALDAVLHERHERTFGHSRVSPSF